MLPILGLAAAAVSALTAGEAALIGASVGAATAIGANALGKKKPDGDSWRYAEMDASDDDMDDETLEAMRLAFKILKRRGKNRRAA